MELTSARRRELRARAHTLHPVVAISANGLSETVLAEIERSLVAHELIKIRTYGIERAVREALLAEICQKLSCAPVQIIGHLLVIYRERIEGEADASGHPRKPEATGRATKKQLAGGSSATQAPPQRRTITTQTSPVRTRRATPNPPRRSNTVRGR
jgi:putative YhbY family RNA-binding protein